MRDATKDKIQKMDTQHRVIIAALRARADSRFAKLEAACITAIGSACDWFGIAPCEKALLLLHESDSTRKARPGVAHVAAVRGVRVRLHSLRDPSLIGQLAVVVGTANDRIQVRLDESGVIIAVPIASIACAAGSNLVIIGNCSSLIILYFFFENTLKRQ